MRHTVATANSPMVTRCAVDAGGVPAEWVETTVATPGQATIVLFHGDRQADELAAATGARVLAIRGRAPLAVYLSMVEDGLDAYAWLLDEGVVLARTVFIGGMAGITTTILLSAGARGLALPAAVAEFHVQSWRYCRRHPIGRRTG